MSGSIGKEKLKQQTGRGEIGSGRLLCNLPGACVVRQKGRAGRRKPEAPSVGNERWIDTLSLMEKNHWTFVKKFLMGENLSVVSFPK